MGSFNVSCSVSHLSIDSGDEIVYFPLEATKYKRDIYTNNDLGATLVYIDTFFAPACFPIFGSYDSYGGIENILRNDSVLFAERWYKKPIEKIWELRENDEKPENIVSGMFVLKSIYDLMINKAIDEYGKSLTHLRKEHSDSFEQISTKMKKEKEEALKYNLNLEYLYATVSSSLTFPRYKTMNEMAVSCIENKKMKNEIIDLVIFEDLLYQVNSFYFPNLSGMQLGNNFISNIINNAALQITKNRIKSMIGKYSEIGV